MHCGAKRTSSRAIRRDEDPLPAESRSLRVGTTVGVAFVVALARLGAPPRCEARAALEVGLVSSWSMSAARRRSCPPWCSSPSSGGARRGARAFFMVARARSTARPPLLSSARSLLPSLVLFGTVLLRAKTHHHAPAGVTYAIIGALFGRWSAIASVAARLARVVAARSLTVARAASGVAFFTTLASLAWAGARVPTWSRAGGGRAATDVAVPAPRERGGVSVWLPRHPRSLCLACRSPRRCWWRVTTASGLGAFLAE
ncbi:MAG: hypothetical protein IPF92_27465 [Myxococcales bacterium]|nr:hypothetical protein [Myxococcales bacterium]